MYIIHIKFIYKYKHWCRDFIQGKRVNNIFWTTLVYDMTHIIQFSCLLWYKLCKYVHCVQLVYCTSITIYWCYEIYNINKTIQPFIPTMIDQPLFIDNIWNCYKRDAVFLLLLNWSLFFWSILEFTFQIVHFWKVIGMDTIQVK